jgi:hypothetical protein
VSCAVVADRLTVQLRGGCSAVDSWLPALGAEDLRRVAAVAVPARKRGQVFGIFGASETQPRPSGMI